MLQRQTLMTILLFIFGLSLAFMTFQDAQVYDVTVAERGNDTLDALSRLLEAKVARKLSESRAPDTIQSPGPENTPPASRIEDIPLRRANAASWSPPTLPAHLQGAAQDDPELIAEIRRNWILMPDDQPLNLSKPQRVYFAQAGQDRWLDEFFHNKTDGFYIECGAYTGEPLSNTLYFERERNWRGLLIEANPTNFQQVLSKHRNAYMLNACLSPNTEAETLNYTSIVSHPYLSRFDSNFQRRKQAIHNKVGNFTEETHTIQCFPLYSILKALGSPDVDFFSIDIEGAEKYVLRTIPLEEISIEVYVIETGEMGPNRDKKVNYYDVLMSDYNYRPHDIEGDTFDVVMYKKHPAQ